ncbi:MULTISPECIES: pyridoxamine 5'-phosphate oxidase family protein [unclassified Nocardia]|uniref:pyridoxamine 5'-phosphate oxidase family protein n=1 Tax=unclassified Nocardia TaxID=2637762 RepID=UPI001CE457C6|nr:MULTISPECIES: pyridoxamine 5'-phosphate oxidase family protein [unclassified Nocardia]
MTDLMTLPQGDVRLLRTELAQDLLATNIPARLAYTAADGTPRVLPMNFVWNGAEVVMSGFAPSHKTRALRARPDVAITIDTTDAPPRVLLLRGRAEITEIDGLAPDYVAAMRKGGDPAVEGYLDMLRAMAPKMERIAVRPTWVALMDFQTRYPSGAPDWMTGGAEETPR